MKPASLVATIFFIVIAIAHLLRVLFGVPVTVGEVSIPIWWSAPACILIGGLAILLWRESRR